MSDVPSDPKIERIFALLGDPEVKELCIKKREHELLPDSLGFNPFRLISDTYRKENFHSDIMASLLDPNESHGAGHRFVHAFIDWLAQLRPLEYLNHLYFNDVRVEREQGRIDILIHDLVSKKAIIIENKINNAPDMDRQLPRYLDNVEKKRCFDPVAIVYLTLNELKDPFENEWESADHDRVHRLLIKAVAFRHDSRNLLDGWIRGCEQLTDRFDTLAVLRQYGSLIQYLGAHAMDMIMMEKFYTKLSDNKFKSLEDARALVNMMNGLPSYRAQRLKEIIWESQCDPLFNATSVKVNVENNSVVFSSSRKADVCAQLCCKEDSTNLILFDCEYSSIGQTRLDDIIASLKGKIEFEWVANENCYCHEYKFPEDEDRLGGDLAVFFPRLAEGWAEISNTRRGAY